MTRDIPEIDSEDIPLPSNGSHIAWHESHIGAADRRKLLHQEPATIWLTGLSGAGKSTIAFELERQLVSDGHLAFVLDGDNIRHGLNRDLDFTPESRRENIRRIAEVAKLFNDAGLLVITAFISPYRLDRAMAREIVGPQNFLEVHLSADIRMCEARDPKGLYRKARAGKIDGFTGVSTSYEPPEHPDIRIDTGHSTVMESVAEIRDRLASRLHQNDF